jgi:hypothetical protein
MGLVSHGLAVGVGYLLGRPEGREQVRQVGRKAVDLTGRPEVARLREQAKGVATEKIGTVKQKVATRTAKDTEGGGTTTGGAADSGVRPRRRLPLPTQRLRFRRSRNAHFPASEGTAAPTSLGGTTVMEDSEAAVLGRSATSPPDSATSTTDRS